MCLPLAAATHPWLSWLVCPGIVVLGVLLEIVARIVSHRAQIRTSKEMLTQQAELEEERRMLGAERRDLDRLYRQALDEVLQLAKEHRIPPRIVPFFGTGPSHPPFENTRRDLVDLVNLIKRDDQEHLERNRRRPRNVGRRRVGWDYENKVKERFEANGFSVYPRGRDAGYQDGGIDLVATKEATLLLIQCKCLGNHNNGPRKGRRKYLGESVIFEFYGALAAFNRTYPAAGPFTPIVCTNTEPTAIGKRIAQQFDIEIQHVKM
ncbi:MAG: restriction endonuclease [Phycisphaerae bacterium]|nr:restriction endonuclease [Phycisphaerae bacterium]